MLKNFWTNLLMLISLLNFGVTVSLYVPRTDAEQCFENYYEAATNATEEYAADYNSCIHTKKDKHTAIKYEKQTEREQVQNAASAICKRFDSCNVLPNDIDYFHCMKKISAANMNDILTIRVISTMALIDLDEKLNQAEKDFLTCSLKAEQKYMNATAMAYNDFVLCLES